MYKKINNFVRKEKINLIKNSKNFEKFELII